MNANLETLFIDLHVDIADYPTAGSTMRFDTYSDFGWILSDVEVSSLTRKESYVSLPHANDVIDFSEYGGSAHYEPREVKYTFWQQFDTRAQMVGAASEFEDWWMALSVNSRVDKVLDPTILGNSTGYIGYWLRPRCIGFERHYQPLSNIATVTVTLRVYPLPQRQAI